MKEKVACGFENKPKAKTQNTENEPRFHVRE